MVDALHINSLEHAPMERTLFIHYTLDQSGLWDFLPQHCGYRGVCDSGWYIMYPNTQHPRHTDAPILVNPQSVVTCTFAWNYGGIRGIDPVDFSDGHSYLVQLAMMDSLGCQMPAPTGSTGSIGHTGITGSSRLPIAVNPRPPYRLPPHRPDSPSNPNPPWPSFPTFPEPGIPGQPTNPFQPYNPGGGGGSGPITSGVRTGPGIIFDGGGGHISPSGDRLIHYFMQPSGVVSIELDRERIHISNPPRTSHPDGRGLIAPIVGSNFNSPPPIRGDPNRSELDRTYINPPNISSESLVPTRTFGDGGNSYGSYGNGSGPFSVGPTNINGLIRKDEVLEVTRVIPPGAPANQSPFGAIIREEPVSNPYPSSVSLNIESVEAERSIDFTKPRAGLPDVTSAADSSFISPGKAVDLNNQTTLLKVELANIAPGAVTLIETSKNEVRLGDQLAVSSAFIPPAGAEFYVTSYIYAVNTDGGPATLLKSGSATATNNSSPAKIKVLFNTSQWKIGGLVLTAIYKDSSGKTIGLASKRIVIRDPSATSYLKTDDGFRSSTSNEATLPQVVKNYAGLANSGMSVFIPSKLGRGLLFSKVENSSNQFSAIAVAKDLISTDKVTLASITPTSLNVTGLAHAFTPTVYMNRYSGAIVSDSRLSIDSEEFMPETHQVALPPSSTSETEMVLFIRPSNNEETESDIYISENYKLKQTSVNSMRRLSDGVMVSYSTPYVYEPLKLLVMGYSSGDLPLSPVYYTGTSNQSGHVTFSGVSGAIEQYMAIICMGERGMYNPVKDAFYTSNITV